jgi:hypothetical protein
MASILFFGLVRLTLAHLFSFLSYVAVSLRSVSWVPNVVKVSRLSVFDCPFGFLLCLLTPPFLLLKSGE